MAPPVPSASVPRHLLTANFYGFTATHRLQSRGAKGPRVALSRKPPSHRRTCINLPHLISEARIKKVSGGYKVLSENGKKNLGGPYKTEKEAEKRLRQVEFFERRKG
jgi:hypothetical protein